jgi:protein-disulfide isomerase
MHMMNRICGPMITREGRNLTEERLLKAHREIADRIGVTGTPLFLIEGEVVFGADIPWMEKLLGSKK